MENIASNAVPAPSMAISSATTTPSTPTTPATVPSAHIKSPVRLLVAALALGYAVDLLFYGKMLGISVPIFVVLSLIALFWLGRVEHVKPAIRNLWIVLPLLFFAFMVAVRSDGILTTLNVCAVIMLLAYTAYFYASSSSYAGGHRIWEFGFLGHLNALLETATASVTQTPALLAASTNSTNMDMVRKVGVRRLLPVARGLLIALPLLILFGALLASADFVFANYMSSLFRVEILTSLQEPLGHLIVVLVAAWLLAGGLAYALSRSDLNRSDLRHSDPSRSDGSGDGSDVVVASEESEGTSVVNRHHTFPTHVVYSTSPSRPLAIGFVEVVTLMILVNALFLLFGWIQFTYLFGGGTNITSEGHTYADYARRGFFELIAISVMTLALILGLRHLVSGSRLNPGVTSKAEASVETGDEADREASRETRRKRWTFNTLSTFMVVLVIVLLASAYWRMLLYEEAYGYTHLRLYVQISEIWLAITFVWLLVTLWVPKMRLGFGIGGFIALIGFAVTLNLANPDALIATENVARWEATGKVDIYYLTQLSDDAVPVLVQALDGMPALNEQQAIEQQAIEQQVIGAEGEKGYQQYVLKGALLNRLRLMEGSLGWRGWTSFNFARQEAYDALVKHRDLLER